MSLRRLLRVEDHLHDARAVADVDEHQPTVVATAMDPARNPHALAHAP
jgi:hypothetical protein